MVTNQVGAPGIISDPSRVAHRTHNSVISRANEHTPALPVPSTQIKVHHQPLKRKHFERILSVVDDYEHAAHEKHVPVDATCYLQKLPAQYPENARAHTTSPTEPHQMRWPMGRLLRTHTGRTPRAPNGKVSHLRGRRHHVVGARRREHRVAALSPHCRANTSPVPKEPHGGEETRPGSVNYGKRLSVHTMDARAALRAGDQNGLIVLSLTLLLAERGLREVCGMGPSTVTNALPLATPPLRSTRPGLGRNCFVFDGSLYQELYGKPSDEETFYVAYTGVLCHLAFLVAEHTSLPAGQRPSTPDIERVLRQAVDPPGMLTPQVPAQLLQGAAQVTCLWGQATSQAQDKSWKARAGVNPGRSKPLAHQQAQKAISCGTATASSSVEVRDEMIL